MAKRKGKKGKAARSAKKGLGNTEPEETAKAPHSFVINRGKLGKNANELLLNFRKVMEPFTASNLKVQKSNVLKDFVSIAGPLNVSHLVIFTKTQTAMYLRIAKLPHGPTLTFQINEYSLVKDIISMQKKSIMYEKLFDHHPLLVLNNFSGDGMHFKLMATTFQNMFPSINVNRTNLNTIRRCLLLNYNEDKTIDLRQYAVKVVPTGMSKAVKKLIQSKVPNLSQYDNIGDFLQKSGNLSESEVEMDTPANIVVLAQPISSRGNITSEKSAVRLFEMGPRLQLQLVKIEDGLMSGEVLYHKFIKKTPEEIKKLKEKLNAKEVLKDKRRAEQERNVKRKKAVEENKDTEKIMDDEREEDLEWYRQEVGEEPDESVLIRSRKRKTPGDDSRPRKKVKFAKDASKNKVSSDHQAYLKGKDQFPRNQKRNKGVSKQKWKFSDGDSRFSSKQNPKKYSKTNRKAR